MDNVHYRGFLSAGTSASIDNEVDFRCQLLSDVIGCEGGRSAADISAGSDYGIPQVLNESQAKRMVGNAYCYAGSRG